MTDVNNVSAGANGTRLDLSNAPGADLDWDSLFPNPELAAQQPQAVTPGTTPQSQPQVAQNQPFLKAGDSVYNTAEDAVNGTIHKDREIARMRGFLKDNGIDPNTLQRNAAAQPQVVQQPTDNQRFFDKIADAATRRDKDAYENTMREFFQTLVEPYRPTLTEMARFKAYQQVSRELPGFKEYYENGGYQETLEKNPLFKNMNQIGETDPNAAQGLPDLYRSAYFYYKGMQPPAQVQTTQATPNTPTVRQQPTLQPSALTPPPPTPNYGKDAWAQSSSSLTQRGTNEARKQLIEDGNRRYENFRFDDVGL